MEDRVDALERQAASLDVLEKQVASLQVEVASLRAGLKGLRCEHRRTSEHLDTISSPPWKRAWFFIQGFRLWRLGVWYRAPWNRSAWED